MSRKKPANKGNSFSTEKLIKKFPISPKIVIADFTIFDNKEYYMPHLQIELRKKRGFSFESLPEQIKKDLKTICQVIAPRHIVIHAKKPNGNFRFFKATLDKGSVSFTQISDIVKYISSLSESNQGQYITDPEDDIRYDFAVLRAKLRIENLRQEAQDLSQLLTEKTSFHHSHEERVAALPS